jgi:hypothetical protein
MLRKSASALHTAIRQLFRNKKALLIMTAIYGLLLASIYAFVSTKEATRTQVVITFALMVLAPLFFFVLQAGSTSYANDEPSTILSWVRNSWKLLVISLPVIAVGILFAYILNKVQSRLNVSNAAVVFTSIRYLLLGVILPLVLIHLWIPTNRDGLRHTIRKGLEHMLAAFSPRSVLIYMAGFVVFALLPYVLLFKTPAIGGVWAQIGIFAARLLGAFSLMLLGWIVTVGALSTQLNPRIVEE